MEYALQYSKTLQFVHASCYVSTVPYPKINCVIPVGFVNQRHYVLCEALYRDHL